MEGGMEVEMEGGMEVEMEVGMEVEMEVGMEVEMGCLSYLPSEGKCQNMVKRGAPRPTSNATFTRKQK